MADRKNKPSQPQRAGPRVDIRSRAIEGARRAGAVPQSARWPESLGRQTRSGYGSLWVKWPIVRPPAGCWLPNGRGRSQAIAANAGVQPLLGPG